MLFLRERQGKNCNRPNYSRVVEKIPLNFLKWCKINFNKTKWQWGFGQNVLFGDYPRLSTFGTKRLSRVTLACAMDSKDSVPEDMQHPYTQQGMTYMIWYTLNFIIKSLFS